MPFEKVHADVKIKRPVSLGGHHAGVHPEVAFALIQNAEIALRLARDVLHRAVRQGGFVAKGKGIIDAQWPVDPMPAVAVLVQREQVRVVLGLCDHDQLKQVPPGQRHVRQGLAPQRIVSEHQSPVPHL